MIKTSKALLVTLALLLSAVQLLTAVHSVSSHHIPLDASAVSFEESDDIDVDADPVHQSEESVIQDCPQCLAEVFAPFVSADQPVLDFRNNTEPLQGFICSTFSRHFSFSAIRAPPASA